MVWMWQAGGACGMAVAGPGTHHEQSTAAPMTYEYSSTYDLSEYSSTYDL